MSQPASNEFDAAKMIVEALKGLDHQQQDRAIRFASESVGLQMPAQRPGSISGAVSTGSSVGESAQPATQDRVVDIRQFVDSKSPKSDQQFATVVAYYYRFVGPPEHHKESINAEDLKNAARLVGRKQPGDASATLHNAKNSGYLDSVGKGAFQINSVGENLVAITLPSNDKEPKPKRSNVEKKKKVKEPTSKKRTPKGDK